MQKWISIIVMLILISACASFTPTIRPDSPLEIPLQYSMYAEGKSGSDHWWEAFDSRELNRLVETALSGNFDIKTAWARLQQADALARQAGARLMPTVDFDVSGDISRYQTKTSPHTDGVISEEKSLYAGLAASYEVDFWGRLRAKRQSEILNFQAAREDLESAAMTVTASVVETWVNILATCKQIAILKDQIRTNQTLLDLEKFHFVNGKSQALDVSQQREALAAAKAQLPGLQLAERQYRSSLGVLLGRAIAADLETQQASMPELIPLPATGLPADLLAARPDVRAAGLRLQSADWAISAARADRLPNITLSTQAAFSSGSLNLLFDNWITVLAGSITGPLFDAGSRKAEVDRTRAVAEEYLAAYAQTVAEAIREVEDNLAAEVRQQEYISLLQDQLNAARVTLKDARLQYLNGKSDYLSYLTALNGVQSLEQQMVVETATQIKYRVTLYRVLGGNWIDSPLAGNAPADRNTASAEN